MHMKTSKSLIVAVLIAFSCTPAADIPDNPKEDSIVLESFVLKAEDNPSLSEDFAFPLNEGTSVKAVCRGLKDVTSLVVSFSGNFT